MGTGEEVASFTSQASEVSISELRRKQNEELENLTLMTQPFKTLKFFVLAVLQYIKRSVAYILAKGGWLLLVNTIIGAAGILILTVEGPHEKHVEEIVKYIGFGLWWVILGVASSIGLGSGLHTFVLYLGPHIGFFTIKAVQCGRVDLKSAPYDTIQLKRTPSWLDKDCSEFGPPVFTSSQVPLSSILPMVQLEAILWGIGTALGELPPYFISRAARLSGGKLNAVEEVDASSSETKGVISTSLYRVKRWFLSHSHHLNFLTILLLASVPNPLFDFAGIMCGQVGIPFWEFFFATMFGKAIIKTHIQTLFIIALCNNQLLDWIENELIWILSFVPGFSSGLPNLVAKLNSVKAKYLKPPSDADPDAMANKPVVTISTIWNTFVWLMIINFSVKIISATAQRYLKKQQEKEMAALMSEAPSSAHTN